MNALRLIWAYVRLGAMNELAYRANFFVQLFQTLIGLGTALAAVAVVFDHTSSLGGWRADELIALVGIYMLVGGLIGLIIRPSLERFMEGVRQGTLDFTLLKPADAQLLISVSNVQIWKVVDVALGLAVIVVALFRIGDDLGVDAALSFAGALLAGTAIVYSFLLILATCAFWFVRVENILFIFQATYDAGRWPVGIYPRWLRAAMTFVVPVAFAITVPTEGLTGRLEWPTLLGAIALAAALLAASRWFWCQGVRRYAGASA